MCVCVRVCNIYIYMYIYMYVCISTILYIVDTHATTHTHTQSTYGQAYARQNLYGQGRKNEAERPEDEAGAPGTRFS
jgi:hypothetical protein